MWIILLIVVISIGAFFWAKHLDDVYYSNGAPGHRPIVDSFGDGMGVYWVKDDKDEN